MRTCGLEEGYDLFRVTTNLILFRETGVLDRELNLASIPYMGSPEGLRHCFVHDSPPVEDSSSQSLVGGQQSSAAGGVGAYGASGVAEGPDCIALPLGRHERPRPLPQRELEKKKVSLKKNKAVV